MTLSSRLAGILAFGAGTAMLLCASTALAQPVRGLYISGEGGASFNQEQEVRLSPIFPSGQDEYKTGVTGIGAMGWGFGNGFRVEIEGNYRNNQLGEFSNSHFPSSAGGRQQSYGTMVNGLFDMDIGKSWLYPYFGGGIGYAWQHSTANIVAPNGVFSQQSGGTYGAMSWQGIFGLAFPVPWVVGLSATAEYRFWSMLGPQSHRATSYGTIGGYDVSRPAQFAVGNRDDRTDYNHSLMLGLRYEFNPAPPPPPPAPVVETAPAPAPARTYLVFFDWDRAALTERARAIVAEAARASSHVRVTRIEVNGYTDNSAAHPGPRGAAYNMDLSNRRAAAVKAELVRDGVPGGVIDTRGFGETHPLVPTAADTREPQNRRVEIILR
ncbi:OmpA family protein [Tanticharoenia sakaeratensis]|uniref:Outer membrane protein n=1 Tax=Tanticharoenia sakaeratensis NBRC 103193 TaxID=1231623 RepID=A0A0D6MQ03_9PROT|nr:OmpA family protein [Tanticharoenia sakaeratensis]GAN55531.1 outer membrane protein [Tanticharoenia sakaeratensis NBRC 103193]GBQ21814.1 outer membrane protein [Tanticharoenia sakaeratensis NBRC 103193]